MIRKLVLFLTFTSVVSAADVNFLIMPDEVIGPISPYIYGVNDVDPGDSGATVRRLGGNRMTGYNWTNNASNAGNAGRHMSDNWLCENHSYTDCDKPGAFAKHFVEENRQYGVQTLMTIPLAGFVAADKDGEVTDREAAPNRRWKRTEFHKRKPYSLAPDPRDPIVYEDEFVNYLVSNFKKGGEGGIRFYDLDNEPGIWPSTHPRIHPEKTSYWEMRNRTEAAAENILRVDPTAMIFGAVCSGWQEFLTLQDAPESGDASVTQTFPTYLDFYLDFIHHLQSAYHKRLVQVLDLHWYSEAQGSGNPSTGLGAKGITENDVTPDFIEARLQAPRSLWDPGYVEKSWITRLSTKGKPIELIPWVKEKIDTRCPGTLLAFSEYDYGAGDHVSGGIAQADVLGIFGKFGIFLAAFGGELKPFNRAAFKLFRNYDGKNGTFGDTAVSAATEDVTRTSCYAATDSKTPGILRVVILNKNQRDSIHGQVKLQGRNTYVSFEAFSFKGDSPEIKPVKKDKVEKNHFDYSLPPLSATLFVLQQ